MWLVVLRISRRGEPFFKKSMRKSLYILALLLIVSCSPRIIQIPVHDTLTVTKTEVLRDTIVEIQLPDETMVATTLDTTSHLETTYAYSEATVSNGVLNHILGTKNTPIKEKIVYKDKIITEIQVREVPVKVEVPKAYIPKWVWWVLGWAAIVTIALGLSIYLRCKRLLI